MTSSASIYYDITIPVSFPQTFTYEEDTWSLDTFIDYPKSLFPSLTEAYPFQVIDPLFIGTEEEPFFATELSKITVPEKKDFKANEHEKSGPKSIFQEDHEAEIEEEQIVSSPKPQKQKSTPQIVDKPSNEQKKNRMLPRAATHEMKNWLMKNEHNPYPDRAKKMEFSRKYNITMCQVERFFINSRRRYL